MNFSLILSTRGRVRQLVRTLESFERNTQQPELCEWLITADLDDAETVDFLLKSYLPGKNQITGRVFIGERPKSLSVALNHMAANAKGHYIFVLNDDSEIMTPDWDNIALAKIQAFRVHQFCKDDVIYGYTDDTSVDYVPGKRYCCFPIISKQSVDALGFIMHPFITGWGGDSGVYRLYEPLNRVVDLRIIKLDHINHNSRERVDHPDKTAQEMRDNCLQWQVDQFGMDVTQDVNKLKALIASKK